MFEDRFEEGMKRTSHVFGKLHVLGGLAYGDQSIYYFCETFPSFESFKEWHGKKCMPYLTVFGA